MNFLAELKRLQQATKQPWHTIDEWRDATEELNDLVEDKLDAIIKLVEAARERVDVGHARGCAKLQGDGDWKCNCGHDRLKMALAALDEEKTSL